MFKIFEAIDPNEREQGFQRIRDTLEAELKRRGVDTQRLVEAVKAFARGEKAPDGFTFMDTVRTPVPVQDQEATKQHLINLDVQALREQVLKMMGDTPLRDIVMLDDENLLYSMHRSRFYGRVFDVELRVESFRWLLSKGYEPFNQAMIEAMMRLEAEGKMGPDKPTDVPGLGGKDAS